MKHLLLLLALILVVGFAGATNVIYDFQNTGGIVPSGFYYVVSGAGTETATITTTDNSNYYLSYSISAAAAKKSMYVFNNPMPSTYWAATYISGSGYSPSPFFVWLKSDGSYIGSWQGAISPPGNTRYTFALTGAGIEAFVDGVDQGIAVATTDIPYYYGVGAYMSKGTPDTTTVAFDDVVVGTDFLSPPAYILDVPPNNYYIQNNVFTGAKGFYTGAGVPLSGTQITVRYAKNDNTVKNLFWNAPGHYDLETLAVSGMAGTATYNLSYLWDNSTGFGSTYWSFQGDTTLSDTIIYQTTGATVNWQYDTYSKGDVAQIPYSVQSGAYWDTSPTGYDYKIMVTDLYGVPHGTNYTVTVQSGTGTFAFSEEDAEGAYIAELIATPKTGGMPLLMGFDITQLTGYVTNYGIVVNAETGANITAANVSITQGSVFNNIITPATGNYSASNMTTGLPVNINVTAAGYYQYTASYTPLVARTININFPLVPLSPTTTGYAIGGVVHATPYGIPVPGKTVWVQNISTGEYYPRTTNIWGYYLGDNLVHLQPYQVWGSGTGYLNSSIDTVIAP